MTTDAFFALFALRLEDNSRRIGNWQPEQYLDGIDIVFSEELKVILGFASGRTEVYEET